MNQLSHRRIWIGHHFLLHNSQELPPGLWVHVYIKWFELWQTVWLGICQSRYCWLSLYRGRLLSSSILLYENACLLVEQQNPYLLIFAARSVRILSTKILKNYFLFPVVNVFSIPENCRPSPKFMPLSIGKKTVFYFKGGYLTSSCLSGPWWRAFYISKQAASHRSKEKSRVFSVLLHRRRIFYPLRTSEHHRHTQQPVISTLLYFIINRVIRAVIIFEITGLFEALFIQ